MFGWEKSSLALAAFTLPPYWMRMASAVSAMSRAPGSDWTRLTALGSARSAAATASGRERLPSLGWPGAPRVTIPMPPPGTRPAMRPAMSLKPADQPWSVGQ